MAITTLAQVRSGLQPPVLYFKPIVGAGLNFSGLPIFSSLWPGVGYPGAGGYNGTLDGVVCNNATVGAMRFLDPPTGNAYLARWEQSRFNSIVNAIGTNSDFLLCDRLWHNGGIDMTSTSAQAITSPTWPARDEDGSTNGRGVLLALEVSAATGVASPVSVTIAYTNSDGTAGRTATAIKAFVAASVPICGTYLFDLQAGDVGIRSVQSITLGASWLSGTVNLVAFRLIAKQAGSVAYNRTHVLDAVTVAMPRLYAGSCLYLMHLQNLGGNNVASPIGQLQYTFG